MDLLYQLKPSCLPKSTLQASIRATESILQAAHSTTYLAKIEDNMTYQVESTHEFDQWWKTLDDGIRVSIDVVVKLLERRGPTLPFPYSSGIQQSRHSHMRELRIQHQGEPYRILYAFDPRRVAVLLLGGNKVGNARWYKENVPKADRLYTQLLEEL